MFFHRRAPYAGFIAVLTLLLFLLASVHAEELQPKSDLLEAIAPGTNYVTWYEKETGLTPDPVYFGAYSITPIDDTLYLGYGTARPAESDGALLASFDGQSLVSLYAPTEQGFIDMEVVNDTIFIPGVDPCCSDGWDLGNVYHYDISSDITTKHRNLPNVIHTWGLWFDPESDQLYASNGSHIGDNTNFLGTVYSSRDMGETWDLFADAADGIGTYRTYDVTGHSGQLYAIYGDTNGSCGLAVRDAQDSWKRIKRNVECRSRLTPFGDKLLAVGTDGKQLITVNPNGRAKTIRFKPTIQNWSYNWGVEANGKFYVVAADGSVYASSDLRKWEAIASSDLDLLTITYWPANDWLIVADRGDDAGLWKIDLSQ